MDIDARITYKEAIALWGKEAQTTMVFEEAGELIVALAHIIRGRTTKEALASEITDVKIMLDQLQIMYDIEEDVAVQYEVKLQRLKNKIERAVGGNSS